MPGPSRRSVPVGPWGLGFNRTSSSSPKATKWQRRQTEIQARVHESGLDVLVAFWGLHKTELLFGPQTNYDPLNSKL